MADRFDFFTVNAPKRDTNDFLIVDSTPTKAGIFTYFEPDGLGGIKQVKELRHPDEVFRSDTLTTLNQIPYTTQENHVSLFTTKDAARKTYGFTLSDAERVDDMARVSIKVLDEKEIEEIENKKNIELSCGYRCDTNGPESFKYGGVWNGEKYDREQTNIRYNHVARVVKARGGESCRIRLDSDSAICGIEADRIDSISDNTNGESIMKTIEMPLPEVAVGDFRLDANSIEFPAEQKGIVDQLRSRENSLVTALKANQDKLDSKETDSTKMQAKLDTLEKENEELKKVNEGLIPLDKANEIAEERSYLFKVADDFKLDMKEVKDMPNNEIKKQVCIKAEKVKDVAKLDNEDYCNAVFDTLDLEFEKKKAASKENLDNHKEDTSKVVSAIDKLARRVS